MINSFDAAIFDLDGTILDSLDVWTKIDYEFLEKKRGIKVPEDYAVAISAMSYREIAEYTINRFGLPDEPSSLMDEWTQMAVYEYSHNIKLKPYVKEYIEYLRRNKKRIVLCTSSPRLFYEPALKNNGIYEMFDVLTGACEAGQGKNSPSVFLFASEKAGVPPRKCLVFEDVLSAAESAKKAGMLVCGVFDKKSNDVRMRKFCNYYINDFGELLQR